MMVSLTEGQKATINPEAVKFLSSIHTIPFVNTITPFLTTPKRVPGIRQGFQEKTAPGEAALIEKHKLRITDITIAGIPVVVAEPNIIQPEKENKIRFKIFGGAFIMGSPKDP
jgi:acetyl esterase/lipase